MILGSDNTIKTLINNILFKFNFITIHIIEYYVYILKHLMFYL